MSIKRVMIALLAVMMFPAAALAQEPAEGTAVLVVQKLFTDGNNVTPVTLNLQCTNGQPNQSSVTVLPSDNDQQGALYGMYEVAFVIDNIAIVNDEGAECTVTEEPIAGYDTRYYCPEGDSDTDENCENQNQGRPLVLPLDNFACAWSDIQEYDANRCFIFNDVKEVEVAVTKVWDVTNAGGNFFDRGVRITLVCNSEIVGGSDYGSYWTDYDDISDSEYVNGEFTSKFYVIPGFPSSDCYAYEDVGDSAVEIEDGCGDSLGDLDAMEVSAGSGDSCTITNTLFFEGIPTLSQYGMAIMALLMLGVGFIGFRRFV